MTPKIRARCIMRINAEDHRLDPTDGMLGWNSPYAFRLPTIQKCVTPARQPCPISVGDMRRCCFRQDVRMDRMPSEDLVARKHPVMLSSCLP
jgi:hypothetical protein